MRFGHAVQQEDGVIIKEETKEVKELVNINTLVMMASFTQSDTVPVSMDSVFSPVTTFHQVVKTLQQP